MSVQGNINQMLSVAGLLISQSGAAKDRQRAKEIEGKAAAANTSLQDIYKNYERVESGEAKPYSEIEMADIEGRIRQNVHDIYTGATAASDPTMMLHIDRNKFGGSRSTPGEGGLSRTEMLSKLGGFREMNDRMTQVEVAKNKAAEARQARELERQASSAFIRSQDPRFMMEMSRLDQGGGV